MGAQEIAIIVSLIHSLYCSFWVFPCRVVVSPRSPAAAKAAMYALSQTITTKVPVRKRGSSFPQAKKSKFRPEIRKVKLQVGYLLSLSLSPLFDAGNMEFTTLFFKRLCPPSWVIFLSSLFSRHAARCCPEGPHSSVLIRPSFSILSRWESCPQQFLSSQAESGGTYPSWHLLLPVILCLCCHGLMSFFMRFLPL